MSRFPSALAFALAFALPAAAHAEDSLPAAARAYFQGEMEEAGAFLGVGAGTAFLGSSLAGKGDFGVGFAAATIPVAAIQIGAGVVLLYRTRKQTRDLLARNAADPAAARKAEIARMRRVNFQFDALLVIETSLVAVGGASMVFGVLDRRDGFVGAGLGLATQAVLTFALDLSAARRARAYANKLGNVVPLVTPTGLGLAGTF